MTPGPRPPQSAGGGRLAENVVHFARVLRAAGVPIAPDKVHDAVRVMPAAGFASRRDWHAALTALFLTRREQQPVFDQAFAIFWRDPAFEERMMALLLPKVRGRMPPPEDLSPRVAEALLPAASRREAGREPEDEIEVDASLTFAATERLRRLDFEKMSGEEWREAKRLLSRLRLPVPEVRTRRHEPSARGATIDLAATLARLGRRGGELAVLEHRRRQSRPPPLVVLCDISGSMHRYTRMFLHFVHALTQDRERVSTLLFGTRLTNVTRELRRRDVDEAVSRVCAAVPDWAGGTRIGACLREFNFRWSRRLLGQNACLLLVTDGLDREDAAALEEEMARLGRSASRLLWLNPLLRYEGFEPSASGIRAMRPYVDEFLPVHNLESLAALAGTLSRPARATRLAA